MQIKSPEYMITAAYYDQQGDCYRVENIHDLHAWHDENKADIIGGADPEDYPFKNSDGAREYLAKYDWVSEDGIVFRKMDYPDKGRTAVAIIVICGMESQEYVSTQEAAELLGIGRPRVIQLLKDGALKGRKFASAWQIEKASVDERIANPPKSGRRW